MGHALEYVLYYRGVPWNIHYIIGRALEYVPHHIYPLYDEISSYL